MRRNARVLATLIAFAACGADAPVVLPARVAVGTPVEYPVELWDLEIEGETMLIVHVDDMGAVDSVLVAESSGYAEFDSAAVAAGRTVRFRPGRKGDRRVEMWVRLPVRFTRAGGAEVGESEEASP